MSEVYGGQKLCECCGAVITADRRMCGACFADRFAKAYDRHAPVQVPEGWKLVPKCPTTDMLSPLRDAAPKWNARSLYASILDLAPSAPVAVAQPASPSVDAEKVMGLVEEYGSAMGRCGLGHYDAVKAANDTLAQIRALLTPATCKGSLQVVGWIPVPIEALQWLFGVHDDGFDWPNSNRLKYGFRSEFARRAGIDSVAVIDWKPAIANQEPQDGR